MPEVGTFSRQAKRNGMTPPEYAVYLVEREGSINAAAREARCNRNTIRYHLNAIGAVVTPTIKVVIPDEVRA